MLRNVAFLLAATSSLATPRSVLELGTIVENRDASGRGKVLIEVRQSTPQTTSVPMVVTRSDGSQDRWVVDCALTACIIEREVPARLGVVVVALDIPPGSVTLSQAMTAATMTWVLPSMATTAEQDAWRSLSSSMCQTQRCTLTTDRALPSLPMGTVMLVGTGNLLRGGAVVAARETDLIIDDRGLFLPGARARIRLAKDKLAAIRAEAVAEQDSRIAIGYPHPLDRAGAMVWLRAPAADIANLAGIIAAHAGEGWLVVGTDNKVVAKGAMPSALTPRHTRTMP